jgi:hypothetical protein
VIKSIITSKKLDTFTLTLNTEEKRWLLEAVEDPDTLLAKEKLPLMEKLIELNLIIDAITYRDPPLWTDQPPTPERFRTRYRQAHSVANTITQRSSKKSV